MLLFTTSLNLSLMSLSLQSRAFESERKLVQASFSRFPILLRYAEFVGPDAERKTFRPFFSSNLESFCEL